MPRIILGVVAVVILVVGAGYYFYRQPVSDYEECAAAGNRIQESYPATCVTPDGKSFTQEIGNELAYITEIIIADPRPNQVVTSPKIVSGQARGPWYFEANFSMDLEDSNGNKLATAVAMAQGDWMTEEFVPFEAKLIFASPSTDRGRLIIYNANPSGLPEDAKSVIIPVKFK